MKYFKSKPLSIMGQISDFITILARHEASLLISVHRLIFLFHLEFFFSGLDYWLLKCRNRKFHSFCQADVSRSQWLLCYCLLCEPKDVSQKRRKKCSRNVPGNWVILIDCCPIIEVLVGNRGWSSDWILFLCPYPSLLYLFLLLGSFTLKTTLILFA